MDFLSKITVGPGITVTGPLAPNTQVPYSWIDPYLFVNSAQTNQCNEVMAYTVTAPSCARGMQKRMNNIRNETIAVPKIFFPFKCAVCSKPPSR